MDSQQAHDTNKLTEQFVSLFAEHRDELFRFILALLPNRADAEDVFQRTSVVLWRKFGDFQVGTNFYYWAARVAQLEVRDYCKVRGREKLVFWTQELVELVADTRHEQQDVLVSRRALLKDCLQKLRPKDRELLELRYSGQTTSKALAESLGKPAVTVYKSLARIRRMLFECVERKLAPDQRG
ncbi:sigma-70 family RNA polymerase sigma factor [Aeoliella sp. ICT_H6.2]|uniref:Sigma-70 family RNA polymerase sigma factor n=1 Tax=Aeoliella straminimaris TaxID=2954799 RepID=A0A9X2F8E3_9BACT|nr:sigma-70 family RNA polymerase sigma factor [Aeoliella straminimaris]